MRITIIAVGKRIPDWVNNGYQEYIKRLPSNIELDLKEITPAIRGKNTNIKKSIEEERLKIRNAIPSDNKVIALDEHGNSISSTQLSSKLGLWMDDHQDISLIIGGADGLSKDLLQSADETWSLSSMTLPHAMVRVIVAEQLYRAWSILQKHPYHRE